MALRKSCATKRLATKETVHNYELRWSIKNAKNRLHARETLLSGQEEISGADKYKFTVSMELSTDTAVDGQLKLIVSISEFHKIPWVHVLMSSHIEKAALHSFGDSLVCEVDKAKRLRFPNFRRDDLLDESKGLIVNDTLTVVLDFVINVGCRSMRLADPADQPPETVFAKALNDKSFTDVVLRTCDDRQFRAHKFVLALRSPVFRAMFESGLKESTESEVEIADCSAEVVEQVLSFIYTCATPKVSDDILYDLLKAADKYDIKDLLAVCENKIAQSTDSNNAAEVLMLADTFGAKKLKESAKNWIAGHISDVMKSPGWEDLSKALVEEILRKVVELNNSK